MDQNFHLLDKDEIKLLEDISMFKTQFENRYDFSFEDTRNRIDVIILNSDDAQIFKEKILLEEEAIRNIIDTEKEERDTEKSEYFSKESEEIDHDRREFLEREHKRREFFEREHKRLSLFESDDKINIFEDRERRGYEQAYSTDWPKDLTIYEKKQIETKDLFEWPTLNQEQHHEYSDEELGVIREQNKDFAKKYREFDHKIQKINNDIKRSKKHKNGDSEIEISRLRLKRSILIDDNRELYSDFTGDVDGSVFGSIDNHQLRQLDLRLRQLKCYLHRLTKDDQAWWSGSLLGCYLPKRDKGRRKLFLFIDNIHNHATSKGITSNSVLASTFTHEMFHAYYDDIESKEFIRCGLHGVREIEEAMTEFGTLCFLKTFNPSIQKDAYNDIRDKLNSKHPYLQCYGLGSVLYDEYCDNKFPKFLQGIRYIPFFEMYQKIQPSPRSDYNAVMTYFHMINRTLNHNDEKACVLLLYKILSYYNIFIKDAGQHYSFDGISESASNRLVYSVLRQYVDYNNKIGKTPSLQQMKKDFVVLGNNLGDKQTFEEESNIKSWRTYEITEKIQLTDATIYPAQSWDNSEGGKMSDFIKLAHNLYMSGKIDKEVIILR